MTEDCTSKSGHGLLLGVCICKQAVRVATLYAPAPILPHGRPSASRAAEQTQRSSTFPRRIGSHADRCSRLTR